MSATLEAEEIRRHKFAGLAPLQRSEDLLRAKDDDADDDSSTGDDQEDSNDLDDDLDVAPATVEPLEQIDDFDEDDFDDDFDDDFEEELEEEEDFTADEDEFDAS